MIVPGRAEKNRNPVAKAKETIWPDRRGTAPQFEIRQPSSTPASEDTICFWYQTYGLALCDDSIARCVDLDQVLGRAGRQRYLDPACRTQAMNTFDRPAQPGRAWIVQDCHLVGPDEESAIAVGVALPVDANCLSGKMDRAAFNRDR